MEKFELNILGCGSALPTTRHFATSQVVNVRDKLYMIDCGEAAQMQFRRSHLKFSRLNHIFISHLHGDHYFGIMGLISTMGLLGRTADIHIYSPAGLQELLQAQLDAFYDKLVFKVIFHVFDTKKPALIFEDRSITVTTIPLKHRVPCCGFLFAEKPRPNHILREMIDFYNVPIYELNRIKNGADYITPEGLVIPNSRLTVPSDAPRKYAYCSDTMYNEGIIEQIRDVDLLFHEATFAETEEKRSKQTMHSTAREAATIASKADAKKLMIGHFSARYENENVLMEEAMSVYPNVILAKENLCISI